MFVRFRSVLVLALVALGCAPLNGGGGDGPPPVALSAGGARTRSLNGATTSAALDRMSKRAPVLNGSVRRAGTGRGTAIYIFDGGVAADQPELAGRVRIGFDAFPSTPRICNPHGTAVAGAAAGATLGVAPEAEIVDVKIIDCETKRGTSRAILAAARWTVADREQHPERAAIANWSFIVDTAREVPAIDSAIQLLRDAGILVVVSAGNYEVDACHVSPANSHLALVVGGTSIVKQAGSAQWRDVRMSESAWGRCIDLYAPGDSVLLPSSDRNAPTSLWSGTSMSAGYVSGAAALVLERNPLASPADVVRTLVARATANVVDERAPGPAAERGRLVYVGPDP